MSDLSPSPRSRNYGADVHDANGDLVAAVHGGADADTEIANARLIASAPEMLEVLQQIASAPWSSIDRDNMEFKATLTCFIREKLLNVVAKAEGLL